MGLISPVSIEAKYYVRDGDVYVCQLCPHECRIPVGGVGRCGARKGDSEKLIANTYGKISYICTDPIEKKPLYHYHPKSKIFSIGSIGCNMSCRHCQNYSISQSNSGNKRTTFKSAEEIVTMCRKEGMDSIAFTYNEPTIWFEYIMDVLAADPGLRCVLASNGLCNEEPLRELCKVTDAFNIDIKGFTDEFYMNVCGAHLEDVLKSVKIIFEEGVHLELTYLIIPGYNDSDHEIRGFSAWVRDNLSRKIPVHFTRFHPDNYFDNVPWTPEETMYAARRIAMEEGLNYVYIGNMMSEEGGNTICPGCGRTVINRTGYLVEIKDMYGSRCAECGHDLRIIR